MIVRMSEETLAALENMPNKMEFDFGDTPVRPHTTLLSVMHHLPHQKLKTE